MTNVHSSFKAYDSFRGFPAPLRGSQRNSSSLMQATWPQHRPMSPLCPLRPFTQSRAILWLQCIRIGVHIWIWVVLSMGYNTTTLMVIKQHKCETASVETCGHYAVTSYHVLSIWLLRQRLPHHSTAAHSWSSDRDAECPVLIKTSINAAQNDSECGLVFLCLSTVHGSCGTRDMNTDIWRDARRPDHDRFINR